MIGRFTHQEAFAVATLMYAVGDVSANMLHSGFGIPKARAEELEGMSPTEEERAYIVSYIQEVRR